MKKNKSTQIVKTGNRGFAAAFILSVFFCLGCKDKVTKVTEPAAAAKPAAVAEATTASKPSTDSIRCDCLNLCFLLKPVVHDAKYQESDTTYWPGYNRYLVISLQSIDEFVRSFSNGVHLKFDKDLRYMTSFEYQAEIAIDNPCVTELENPGLTFLQQVYFPLQTNAGKRYLGSPITFEKKEERNIPSFGRALVYSYTVEAANVAPHYLHIILHDKKPGESYEWNGILLASDGIIWKQAKGGSIPLVKLSMRENSLVAPLSYDGDRFIPVALLRQKLDPEAQEDVY